MDMRMPTGAAVGAAAPSEVDTMTATASPFGTRFPRVLLMTPAGVALDVTHEAGRLLSAARHASPPPCADTGRCPADWALLCSHVGPCAVRDDPEPTPPPVQHLTGREAEIVAQLRQGATNKEIARRLGIQEDTVKKHLQSVYGKLGVHRRALVLLRTTPPSP
jgi:DNA-binding CsgD family transcriptional regulator